MTEETTTPSTLAQLRELVPHRPLTPSEARQILERQATRLLKLTETLGPPVPVDEIVRSLPRLELRTSSALPTSGRTQWNGSRWVILVASDEAPARQRFSVGHELAHVIYHPLEDLVLPAYADVAAEARIEQACEYFSACLLMPRLWMKRAFYDEGIRDVPSLARLFGVSWVAMQLRLEQLGLEQPHHQRRRAGRAA